MDGRRAALICVALSLPATARAKTSLQAQLTLSGGWTDNVKSTSSNPSEQMGNGPPEADGFFQVRPSLILTTGTPRFVQRLAYIFTADLFAKHTEANAYSNRLDWNGFITTSKTTDMLLRVSFTEGRLSTFSLATGSDLTTVGATRPQPTTFAGASAFEQLSWDITSQWRFYQTILFNGFWPLVPDLTPDTYDIDQHIIAERDWRDDALAIDFKLDFALFSQLLGPGPDPMAGGRPGIIVISPEQDVLINGATLRWKHDFGYYWTSQLDLGFVELDLTKGASQPIWRPIALAALRYLNPNGTLDLSYSHLVTPNAIVASTFEVDQVILRGGIPLGPLEKTHLTLSATGGYQYARAVDFKSGGSLSYTHIIVADATLAWSPRLEFSIYARYQFLDQLGNASGNDTTPLPSFHKHVVMLGLTGTWPGAAAAVVPSRAALRVDRGDAVNIPEPHHEPSKY